MTTEEQLREKLAYTVREAAKVIGLSTSSLYRLSDAGKLQMKRVGARSFITRDELLRLLDEAPTRGKH